MAVPQNAAELNQALHGRLSHVEMLINEILRCKKNVVENSALVKEQIHSAFRGEASALEQRKIQLSRQVDVLASHQENRLQVDLAKLYQYQGQLRSLLNLSESQQLCLGFGIHGIPEMPNVVTTAHELRFTCVGDRQTRDSTEALGIVEVNGRLPSLDLEEEGYGDLDHHLLHKDISAEDFQKHSTSHSNDPWLMYHVGDGMSDDDFEVVGRCLPKSLSATSSSIEAVSMDEDDCLEKPTRVATKNSVTEEGTRVCKSLSLSSPFYEDDPTFWLLCSKKEPTSSTQLHIACRPKENSFLDKDNSSFLLHDHLYSLTLREDNSCPSSTFGSASSDELSWLLSSKCGTSYSSSGSTVCSEMAKKDAAEKAGLQGGSVWLLSSQTSGANVGLYGMKIREMFSVYFDQTDDTRWIMSQKNMP